MTQDGRLKAAGGKASKDSPAAVDFATALFTGDLFGELTGSLPVLTLDIPARPVEVTDPTVLDDAATDGADSATRNAGTDAAKRSQEDLSALAPNESVRGVVSEPRRPATSATSQNLDRDASEAIDDTALSGRPALPGEPALSGETALSGEPALSSETALSSEPALYGVNQPAFERITLSHDRVRVRIAGRSPSDAIEGHLADASVSGLLIRVPSKPTLPNEDVDLVLGLAGGLEVTFPARMVRATSTSVAVQYFAGDSTLRFRLRFMAEALTQLDAPPWIEIKTRRSDAAQESRFDRETREMAVLWTQVLDDFDNKDKHQAFLNACIKASRLDYGLERYRVYKRENRDADVDEYLKQIGTILGFFVLARTPDEDAEASRSRKRTATIALVIALSVLALLVAQEMISKMSVTEDRTKATIRSTQHEE